MYRSLIIAKVVPGSEHQVARVFAESDATDLPMLAGVRHRSLYHLHDLYAHFLETTTPGLEAVEQIRGRPEFRQISQRLSPYVSAYLPTWQSPRDAFADCFYQWDAPSTAASQRTDREPIGSMES